MANRDFAQEYGITKRAASKVLSGRQRNNHRSPYFGITSERHLEAVKEVASKPKAQS